MQADRTRPEASAAEEMERIPYEPLMDVEKKLIAWSIGIGVVLLIILVWVSYTFFPGG